MLSFITERGEIDRYGANHMCLNYVKSEKIVFVIKKRVITMNL
jgi:hypothetical protein